ncbi:MAG: hypothetical protein WD342_13900 [Verrucomicrobiales bacterium]
MKITPAILALCLLAFETRAREFTDAEGRTIEAELVAHAGDNVVIRMGAKEFAVPVSTFSLDDQQYIKTWIDENPSSIRLNLGYYTDLKKGDTAQSKAPGRMIDDKLKTIPYTYEMIVYNKDIAPLEDIEIRYEIYVADFVDTRNNRFTRMAVGGNKTERLQTIAGKFPVAEIPPQGRQDFSRTFDTEFYIDRDGGKTDASAIDKVIGVRIRLYQGERLLGEHEEGEDSTRMAKTSWTDEEPSEGTVIEE